MTKKIAGTIDMTPQWIAVLPILLVALEEGSEKGKEMARQELRRMAQLADRIGDAHSVVKMTDEQKNVIITRMLTRGGGFVQAMAVAYQRADLDNRNKLEVAFHQYFTDYSKG